MAEVTRRPVSEDIRRAMLKKVQFYDSIRGQDVRKNNIVYWDYVVLTAMDEAQRKCYEVQLDSKLRRGELPLGVEYRVIADPPGAKIGNGGATLHAVEELERMYGMDKLEKAKVLLLHGGGLSQRLPSNSVLGKPFTALPIGDPVYQAIDVKLVVCSEFPQRMKPGIFISCPDCLELFTLENGDWTFEKPGMTAVAHPSPIEIGTTHGVFVLAEKPHHQKDNVSMDSLPSVHQAACRKFIHKPSKEKMRKDGATFTVNGQEYVYTDSEYFMDWPIAKKLLQAYKQMKPLTCEICAYGDFLQALGPEASEEYFENFANVIEASESLVKTRQRFYQLLRGTQFNVLSLNKSKFYHIGTTQEYLHHYCLDEVFRFELGSSLKVMTKFISSSAESVQKMGSSCVIHSVLECPITLGSSCVLEYCKIGSDVVVGDNSILSNMVIPENTHIPSHSFLHTVCISEGAQSGLFVTVAFGVYDNLKKVQPVQKISSLSYRSVPLDEALSYLGHTESIWPTDCTLTNLWHAELFPAFVSQEDSVLYGIAMVTALRHKRSIKELDTPTSTGRLYSMNDVISRKDVQGTLAIREHIRSELT